LGPFQIKYLPNASADFPTHLRPAARRNDDCA
jgi:hypothetical protein